MSSIAKYRAMVDGGLADYRHAKAAAIEEQAALEAAESGVSTGIAAREVLQLVSAAVQQQAHARIAAIVSRCLEAVFEEPYTFQIQFERKRGKTEARLVFVRDGMEIDPMNASGGGVVDVAAFALRVSCMLLAKPPVRRLMILDEPFRFVSTEYRERVRLLLEALSEELGIQFIVVTHMTELQMGKVIEL